MFYYPREWSLSNSLGLDSGIYSISSSHPIPITTVLDPTRVALLLETRPLSHIPALVTHFISVLPLAWVFRFVGSNATLSLVSSTNGLLPHIQTGKLVLTELPSKYPIASQEETSATFTTLSFYQEFLAPAEWLLVYQTDSMICSASNHSVEEWIDKKHAWVGAPWNTGNITGGNGGLSLRHVPPIIEILKNDSRPANDGLWEDRWLCDRLGLIPGTNMPNQLMEMEFSVERVWSERPWGYHLGTSGKALWGEIWDNMTRRKQILDYCPEVKIILDLK